MADKIAEIAALSDADVSARATAATKVRVEKELDAPLVSTRVMFFQRRAPRRPEEDKDKTDDQLPIEVWAEIVNEASKTVEQVRAADLFGDIGKKAIERAHAYIAEEVSP